jgi:hypothetical protein
MTWDGRTNAGADAPDGDYTLHFTARDKAGTNGVGKTRDVRVIGFLGAVRSSARIFYPHDNDRWAPTTVLTFNLATPATVTWTIRDAANNVLVTHLADAALPAGTQSWTWDGRNAEGALLPVGTYTSFVAASDGTRAISQAIKVEMNAFSIATSTPTAHRGSKLTVTVTSSEPLSSGVRLYVMQPGVATWAITLTKLDSRVSRGTITLKTSGSTGTVRLVVKALDYDGRSQGTTRSMPLS